MTTFDGAVIEEQGVTFAIAIVKPSALNSPDKDETLAAMSMAFDGLPTVLMSQDHNGTPTFYGREDIVDFLADVPLEAIPWSTYSLS